MTTKTAISQYLQAGVVYGPLIVWFIYLKLMARYFRLTKIDFTCKSNNITKLSQETSDKATSDQKYIGLSILNATSTYSDEKLN